MQNSCRQRSRKTCLWRRLREFHHYKRGSGRIIAVDRRSRRCHSTRRPRKREIDRNLARANPSAADCVGPLTYNRKKVRIARFRPVEIMEACARKNGRFLVKEYRIRIMTANYH